MSENELKAELAGLWERQRDKVLERVYLIEHAILALQRGNLNDDLRRNALNESHKLAGLVGTFGFNEASRLARELESSLDMRRRLEPGEAPALLVRIAAIRADLERSLELSPTLPVPTDDRPLILLVEDDVELAEQLVEQTTARGMQAELITDPTAARQRIRQRRPDLVVLDLSFPNADTDGLEVLKDLAGLTPPVPTLVLTGRRGMLDRVDVARLGGCGFLQKPVPADQVMEEIQEILQRGRGPQSRVLAVDDDPHILATLQSLLERGGYAVTTLSDPLRFWDLLEETAPDMLILDVSMPTMSGIDLCRVVRNDPRWKGLPVLFLTASNDTATVHDIFTAGADDYVAKPIAGPELLARLANRMERTRLQRSLSETDYLTRVSTRRQGVQDFQRLFLLARRYRESVCVAVLDIDHFKRVNDTYGHATGDVVLQRIGELLLRRFRGYDVVARWGGEEFMIGMYGMSRADGVERLAQMLESLREEEFIAPSGDAFHVTFSAGVSAYPHDGDDLHTLYRAADRALYQAKGAGRARIFHTGRPLIHAADVVILDPDPSRASELIAALELRGYSCHLGEPQDQGSETSLRVVPPYTVAEVLHRVRTQQ